MESGGTERDMAREVDIWWEGDRLKASLRWTNKRGRISFFLIQHKPTINCDECPFNGKPICSKWRRNRRQRGRLLVEPHLCTLLWELPGDNKFDRRKEIMRWKLIGPVGREKKNRN